MSRKPIPKNIVFSVISKCTAREIKNVTLSTKALKEQNNARGFCGEIFVLRPEVVYGYDERKKTEIEKEIKAELFHN